jgi:broad specificity phosphatase PhoE
MTTARHGTLFLIRHGQTGGNRHRYVGWDDEPLDDEGRRQALEVSSWLQSEAIDAVFVSPLVRARSTAEPIVSGQRAAGRICPLAIRRELMEIHYGDFQGVLKADRPLRLRQEHLRNRMPAGESLLDVEARVRVIARELASLLAKGGTVAVVGHFWSNRILAGVLREQALPELLNRSHYKPANGSIWRMRFEATGRVLRCRDADAWPAPPRDGAAVL